MQNLDLSKNKKMPVNNNRNEVAEIKKMIKVQNDYLKEIYENTKKTKRYIFLGRVISLIYLLMIIAPIILAIMYLPSFFESNIKPITQTIQSGGGNNILEYVNDLKDQGVDLEDLIKMYR
ncbi:MAG: hypothetical protein ABIA91_01035 [Patescibacteria group bacterium]